MLIHPTDLEEVFLIEPRIFSDHRGLFLEAYNERTFADAGITARFVQENESESRQGVLRGLHYQLKKPQGKLIRVLRGEIFDVAVDIRPQSKTFRHWTGINLRAAEHKMVWIPKGFAHGFYTLSESAYVVYSVTEFYAPDDERTLLWNDPDVGIRWPFQGEPILSDKDRKGHSLNGGSAAALGRL